MSASKGKKTVLITGCSSGIGEALAKEFHAKGYHVIATARRIESIAHLGKMGMSTVKLDVTNAETIAAARKEVDAITGGELDVLVNNAGFSQSGAFLDLPTAATEALFATNVFGPMALTAAFGPSLVSASSSSSHRALVINISSLSAVVPMPFMGAYAASKAALNSYSRTLAVELAPFDVDVMAVMAGYVSTSISANAKHVAGDAELGKGRVPEGSLYEPIAYLAAGVKAPENPTTADEFAVLLVAEARKGKSWQLGPFRWGGRKEWVWLGTNVWLVKTLSFLGEGVMQYGLLGMSGLGKAREVIQKQKRS